MNDEMKEPDEEKALSESDERKPDFKAEQFSDGASGTSSSEIPPSNEDDGARKNEENDSLLTRAIHKLGNKKRAAIAAAVAVVIIFSLPMLFPQLFCSHKLWANATCTSPRTCKSTAKPRGNRLDTNGKKQRARFRRPVNAAVKPRGNPLGINRARGLPKLTTWTPPQRKYENAKNAERSLTLATKRKLLPFLATESFQFPQKALLIDLTRNSLISPIAAA